MTQFSDASERNGGRLDEDSESISESDGRTARRALRIGAISLASAALLVVLTLPTRGPWQDGQWFGRDSGVFLYGGWRVLNGEVPYRDFWDHKWPAIYYVDALGLFLGQRTVWGVLALEIMVIAFAAALSFLTINHLAGHIPAALSVVGMLAVLSQIIDGGNLVEEYALAFNFAAIYLFRRTQATNASSWMFLALGVTATVPLLFRPNLAGTAIAVGVSIVLTMILSPSRRQSFGHLTLVMLGGAMVVVPIVVYLWSQEALQRFWDAAVRYNFWYSSSDRSMRWDAIMTGMDRLSTSGMHILAIVGWLLGTFHLISSFREKKEAEPFLVFCVVALPLELALVSMSGRTYDHYYITLLPIVTVLAAIALSAVLRGLSARRSEWLKEPSSVTMSVALAVAMVFLPANDLVDRVTELNGRVYPHTLAIQYATDHLNGDQTLLVWGNDPSVNFYADRTAPGRFPYQHPIFTGDQQAEYAAEFLNDLRSDPPTMIFDATSLYGPVPPLDQKRRSDWITNTRAGTPGLGAHTAPAISPEAETLLQFITRNYIEYDVIQGGSQVWIVYFRADTPPN